MLGMRRIGWQEDLRSHVVVICRYTATWVANCCLYCAVRGRNPGNCIAPFCWEFQARSGTSSSNSVNMTVLEYVEVWGRKQGYLMACSVIFDFLELRISSSRLSEQSWKLCNEGVWRGTSCSQVRSIRPIWSPCFPCYRAIMTMELRNCDQ